jgi:hypothetical protein
MGRRSRHHQQLAVIDRHRVSQGQLAATPGLDRPVHPHRTRLDALLGLAAGGYQAMHLQELIELHGGAEMGGAGWQPGPL